MTYRVLDLFCGAGGAAVGLHRAWPDAEIVGVDIVQQKHYPFAFVQGDAITFPLDGYDFIWASPECQGYSRTQSLHRNKYARMIGQVRERLEQSGAVYVIENVEDAPLDKCILLCGSSFGLNVRRHRLFECNQLLLSPGCRHDLQPEPLEVVGHFGGNEKHRKPRNLADASAAMGIDWMTGAEIVQAIPPAYSEYIARQIRQP